MNGKTLTAEEISLLRADAARVFPQLAAEYAAKLGVTYNRVTVKLLKSRWGSCSEKGNLNFNILLMLAPESVQRYVVVHELCHRIEMNHSKAFWANVAYLLPDYKRDAGWLKENGGNLLRRAGLY